jgi:hypothetical protein
MSLKNNTHDYTEPADKQHYKRRYLLRKLEEAEAEKQIKTFNNDREHDQTDGDKDGTL